MLRSRTVKAQLLFRRRIVQTEGIFAELVLWKLAQPLPGCVHPYKYRLALVARDVCVLRYDNESGKGDHRHWTGTEQAYSFTNVDVLISDFFEDVTRWLHEHSDH